MPVALITGASGYIGSRLTALLLAQGWQVHALLRPASSLALLPGHAALRLHRCGGGAQGDVAALEQLLAEARPDVVFHLAAKVLGQHGAADVQPLLEANLLFGSQLLEAMSRQGVRRLVNTGTFWQHYGGAAYSPVNLYAASKQAFEALLQFYADAGGLDAITLKLFDIYGPADPRPKLFQLLAQAQASGQTLELSPGEQSLDLVHVDDVVCAYAQAASRLLAREAAGHVCHAVSGGAPLRLREVVALYERISGRAVPLRWGGRPYRAREMMTPSCPDPALPGWQARIGLEAGLASLIRSSPPPAA